MRRHTVVPLTLSVGGTLLLAGCSPANLPAWAADACNIFASWDDAARPEADRNRLAAALASTVPPAEDSAIARRSRAFAAAMTAGDAADVEAAGALFRDECVTGGWEPAEG